MMDAEHGFEKFLTENEVDDLKVKKEGEAEEEEEISKNEEEKVNPLLKNCREKIPKLHLFDDNIVYLKTKF